MIRYVMNFMASELTTAAILEQMIYIIDNHLLDNIVLESSMLPNKNLTIDSLVKISPIDDHITYGVQIHI